MITGELKSKIDKIWNDFWTGGISNPLTVIEQFTYLIFIKQLDDKQTVNEKKANLLGVPTENPIYTAHNAHCVGLVLEKKIRKRCLTSLQNHKEN